MFDYKISKHPHFDEACRAFALRHNMAKLAERAGMNVQTLRNKLNPDQPHQLNAPDIWLLTDLTEDSTLVDGFLAQIHCLPCVPINEVAKEKLPHYVMSATAEIGRVAAGAVSGDVKTSAGRRDAISSINSVMRHLVTLIEELRQRGVNFRSLTDSIDTSTPMGRFFFHVMGALAEMERELIVERTRAGLAAARAKGRVGGRRPKLTSEQWAQIGRLLEAGESRQRIALIFDVGVSTIYRKFPANKSNESP